MKQLIFSMLIAVTVLSCIQTTTGNVISDQAKTDTLMAASNSVLASQGYAIGDAATDFSLPSTTGQKVSLSHYPSAKGFIIIFTCNHCPYAVAYEKRIIELNKKYAVKGYPVIAISPNDTTIVPEDGLAEMKKRSKLMAYTFPYCIDENQSVYPKYGATKTPHIFVLNKELGQNMVRYIGAIDNNYEDASDVTERYVEDAVNALLAGTEIKIKTTKAIGCSIKDKRK